MVEDHIKVSTDLLKGLARGFTFIFTAGLIIYQPAGGWGIIVGGIIGGCAYWGWSE